jgi:hypothetical protein
MKRQLVGMVGGHYRDWGSGQPSGSEADKRPVDEMRLDDAGPTPAQQADQFRGRGRVRGAGPGAKRKRLDAERAHIFLQGSGRAHAADRQPGLVKSSRFDQCAEVWVRSRIADHMHDRYFRRGQTVLLSGTAGQRRPV